ncbi:MAG: hypothetical protein IT204_22765 [Fimbriimonadaceae bacterium]|nr:hypothetical protein [Fimbriimonadaceae bacterium]
MRAAWLGLCCLSAVVAQEAVTVAPGVTELAEVGLFRVGWQSYDQPVEYMPDGWSSHFDDRTGISYHLGDQVLGRPAILLHSPWRVAPGRMFVEYRLRLPQATPISFRTGITMNPYSMEPDRSDGVTFSAALLDGTERELFREHYAQAAWKDFSFDLSASAGREVVLRLQVEPGPARNSSFDFSYWSQPQIICGPPGTAPRDRLAELLAKPAYRAVEGVSLEAVANRPGAEQGVAPATLLPAETALERAADGFRFITKAADATVVYNWRPTSGTLDDLTVQVDDGRVLRPAAGGGVTLVVGERPIRGQGGSLVSATADAARRSARVEWRYPAEQGGAVVTWTLGLAGRALAVRAECATAQVSSFSLGQLAGAALRRRLGVPYLLGACDYLPADALFASRYLDWTVSHASACPQGEAAYHTLTDGRRNALLESGYVVVSPHFAEVLPNLPHPVSPYLALLGPKVMLDLWGHQPGGYAGDAALLRNLKDHGVDHVAIIQHDWQRYGYDVKLPDHLPPNPAYGGAAGMAEFGKAARECGYVWSLHENYIDLYPDAPSYDPSARVLQADGQPSPAWYNPGTKVQSYGLKCNRALEYAKQVAPAAHQQFGTNAAYLDVHTCVPPWHQLDHEAGQPLAGMALSKVQHDTALYQYMRQAHEGPLFGEGNNQFYWAGRCDGVEAQVSGGEDHTALLDFDLLKLHPQMVNHGMGYYERWFRQGYDAHFGQNVGTATDLDKYRAQEITYGHAGFIGHALTGNVEHIAKEHHLLHAVQRLANTSRVTAVDYAVGERFVSASLALAVSQTQRQRIRYASGLTVWVNWAAEPWTVDGHALPQWGWRAVGPDSEAACELRDGKVVDVAQTPDYTYVDARTWYPQPYVNRPIDVEPRLRELKHLGGDQIEVTYEWRVGQKLDDDYHCFVHFTNDAADQWGGDDILWQHDHGLPKPTSQWQPGEVIVDGPHRLTVPATKFATHDITIGLWKTGRLRLSGVRAKGERILLGRLAITQTNGQVTKVSPQPVTTTDDQVGPQPDWNVRLNPPTTAAAHGLLRTTGAAKLVASSARSWVVYPYPRGRAFQVSVQVGTPRPRLRVRALAAGSGQDLGEVAATAADGWVTFTVGQPGAGRYEIAF